MALLGYGTVGAAVDRLLSESAGDISVRRVTASVSCERSSASAAIPVIKVLREALVATNIHRVLGIVNGDDELHPHRGHGRPPDRLGDARGREARRPRGAGARRPPSPSRRRGGGVQRRHAPGDAIREITLEGPGAGGLETASAVVADIVGVIGTTGTGFLQNDACWRTLERLPPGELRSPYYVRLVVEDRAGVLAHVALRLAAHGVSVARLVQQQENGSATLHVVTHEGARRRPRGRPRRGRRAPRDQGSAGCAPGDLRPGRPRSRLGVTRRQEVSAG
ncbi:MAG: hypothetical protein ACRDNE_03340 [Gaiellaceae bacterium]